MEQYLKHGRLGSVLDGLGLRVLIAASCAAWFFLLWGVNVPALLSGGSLSILVFTGLRLSRRRTVSRREDALRRRLGGEMMLEDMLLCPEKQAHFQAALLLGLRYPLTMERVTEEGMLCRSEGVLLLIGCVRTPEKCEAGPDALLPLQRACRKHGAQRGVACLTGRCSGQTALYAEQSPVPVRIIRRETLLQLAGQACPATNEQLVALGKRKKRLPPAGSFLKSVTHRSKAKRYWGYGLGLTLMFVLTGLWYYPIPGLICLVLSSVCRCLPTEPEAL